MHAALSKAGCVKAEVVQTSSWADGLDIYSTSGETTGLFSETVIELAGVLLNPSSLLTVSRSISAFGSHSQKY